MRQPYYPYITEADRPDCFYRHMACLWHIALHRRGLTRRHWTWQFGATATYQHNTMESRRTRGVPRHGRQAGCRRHRRCIHKHPVSRRDYLWTVAFGVPAPRAGFGRRHSTGNSRRIPEEPDQPVGGSSAYAMPFRVAGLRTQDPPHPCVSGIASSLPGHIPP